MESICKVCGCSTSNLSNHVLYKHVREGVIASLEDYYRKFVYTGDPEKLGKCVTCGKPVPFISVNKGYRIHCCHECSQKDPEVRKRKKENTKKALIEKYGVTNAGQVPGSREKTRKTKKIRYGSERYNNPEKYKKTMLERYGVENPAKSEDIQERKKKTNLERYGTTFPANSVENRKKIKQRNLEKYGVEWSQQRPEIKAKSVQTSIKKYGGVLMGSPKLRSKIKKTMLERYGVESNLSLPETQEARVRYWQRTLGVSSPLADPKIREKALQGMERKYGTRYAMQVPELFEKQKSTVGGSYRARKYTTKAGEELTYLSEMEHTFLVDCDEAGLDVVKGDTVKYTRPDDGMKHFFYVDFKILYPDGTKQLVEIKGTTGYYYRAVQTGLQKAKNEAAEEFSVQQGYRPYLFLLNYKKGDITKWI